MICKPIKDVRYVIAGSVFTHAKLLFKNKPADGGGERGREESGGRREKRQVTADIT